MSSSGAGYQMLLYRLSIGAQSCDWYDRGGTYDVGYYREVEVSGVIPRFFV